MVVCLYVAHFIVRSLERLSPSPRASVRQSCALLAQPDRASDYADMRR